MGYEDYLSGDHWQNRRKDFLSKEINQSCYVCGNKGHLHVHHLHYRNIGKEEDCDLKSLCRGCHKRLHTDKNGNIVIDHDGRRLAKMIVRKERKKRKRENREKRKASVFPGWGSAIKSATNQLKVPCAKRYYKGKRY